MREPSSSEKLRNCAAPAANGLKPQYAGGGPLHALAVLTACATFPLIFMGGLVTSHQAGMSVPDWPNSYGYNMFLFPPRFWIGGIFYEHTHRLMGTVVGFLSVILLLWGWGPSAKRGLRRVAALVTVLSVAGLVIGLAGVLTTASGTRGMLFRQLLVGCGGLGACAMIAWLARRPVASRRVRWLAAAVFAAVLFQGILGGLRVVLVKLDLAIIHACFAQAFFCLAAFMALATSRWWNDPQTAQAGTSAGNKEGTGMSLRDFGQAGLSAPLKSGHRLIPLGVVTVAIIYLQLIVGATMRHFQAGLAIPDLPLAYGKLLPPVTADQMEAINSLRSRQLNLDPVTLGQVWLHFGHRVGAIFVGTLVLALAAVVLGRYRRQPKLVVPAVLLIVLLLAQLTLGVLTVLLRKPADVASAHVAVGALVLVTSFVLTARAARLYGLRRPAVAPESGVSDMAIPEVLAVG